MIDIRELRRNPEAYLAKLARKGAGELGQELLDLDAAWRATTTSAESLRAKLKSSGKPTAEQREELQRAKEQFQETESKLAELEARRSGYRHGDNYVCRGRPGNGISRTTQGRRHLRRIGQPDVGGSRRYLDAQIARRFSIDLCGGAADGNRRRAAHLLGSPAYRCRIRSNPPDHNARQPACNEV